MLCGALLAPADASFAQALAGDGLRAALGDSADELWIYDDLAAGFAAAEQSGKPLLVSFRCVP